MQTAGCRTVIEGLLTYLKDPNRDPTVLDAIVHHVSTCPRCERKMEQFLRALAMDEEDLLTCQACQALLPEYLQAETRGQAEEARWHPVAVHLETCPYCSAEYVALLEMLDLAYGEGEREPPHYPEPKLPFLQAELTKEPPESGRAWYQDALGRLIIEFSAELLRALRTSAYQPAHAAGLKSNRAPNILWQFSLKEAVEDMEVTVTAEADRGDSAFCTLAVEVNIPSKGGWPYLAGTTVALKRGKTVLGVRQTDAFGLVLFERVLKDDLAHLALEITPRS